MPVIDTISYLKLSLTDTILSININRENEKFYVIRKHLGTYDFIGFKVNDGSLYLVEYKSYKRIGNLDRFINNFYSLYEKTDEKSLKEWLTIKDIIL